MQVQRKRWEEEPNLNGLRGHKQCDWQEAIANSTISQI